MRDGGAGPSGATITITGAGVSAKSVTVSVGQSVTFVNNDNKAHEIASNPHPVHGTCPSIESGLGTIGAGQTKTTHAFANAGTCGFHDHLDDGNASLQGAMSCSNRGARRNSRLRNSQVPINAQRPTPNGQLPTANSQRPTPNGQKRPR